MIDIYICIGCVRNNIRFVGGSINIGISNKNIEMIVDFKKKRKKQNSFSQRSGGWPKGGARAPSSLMESDFSKKKNLFFFPK